MMLRKCKPGMITVVQASNEYDGYKHISFFIFNIKATIQYTVIRNILTWLNIKTVVFNWK
jgi:hypothetical protein